MSKGLFLTVNVVWLFAVIVAGESIKDQVAAAEKRAQVAEDKYAKVEKHLPRILEQAKAQGVMTGMEMGCGK